MARAAGTSPKETAAALRRLQGGGLVGEEEGELRALTDTLRDILKGAAPAERPADHGTGDDQTESLLRTFVKDGRLLSVPAQIGRRRTVLHYLAGRAFEPDTKYSEREVNDKLRPWSEGSGTDHVAIRRYLIELRLLDRDNRGLYWLLPDAA
uniref:DUF2087 domain-containing protein n=1 Tax=Streptomyces sp. NBC_01393 TaxID=2903851 RepID=A0AAU3I1N2_9ACTN